ncbi:hypothetical protein [Metabacillus malikii]|uniref:General stress protein CsbA n=1 Tax=Metabacillus malikii TaxID=1504265 RepID=A0ABT9ZIG2_9BACI|nr:hypothetical protein [Metabacillus malikii]MDQ0232063.1 general stress protein CsbA [Metabacillus malikii]
MNKVLSFFKEIVLDMTSMTKGFFYGFFIVGLFVVICSLIITGLIFMKNLFL